MLEAAPGTVTAQHPLTVGDQGHQPDPGTAAAYLKATTAVTLIYSKPGSQENQTEFECIKTKLQHIHIKKLFWMQRATNPKHYRLQTLSRHRRCMQGPSQKGTVGKAK